MAIFPRIQSPCPYKDNLFAIMDGSHCRMCKREVHDITDLSDGERLALVAGCKDEICVSYRLAAKTAIAAAAMGAGFGMSGAAMAQDNTVVSSATYADPDAMPEEDMVIMVGGLKQPKHATWIETKKPAGMAALPVIYEDDTAPAHKRAPEKTSNTTRHPETKAAS